MSHTPHTPGPWQVETASIRGITQEIFVRVDGDETAIASDIRDRDGNFCYANAHLIAAAPELYEACKKLLYWADTIAPTPELANDRKMAIAALSKARGEP